VCQAGTRKMSSCITAEHQYIQEKDLNLCARTDKQVNKGEGTQVNNLDASARAAGTPWIIGDRAAALRCLKLEEAGGRHRR
jgi:hypothetical protein